MASEATDRTGVRPLLLPEALTFKRRWAGAGVVGAACTR
jgi:hypothetical protein